MIFSKTGKNGLPLWWLIFKGDKVVTRRPPPCIHCGKKEWEHTPSDRGMICLTVATAKRVVARRRAEVIGKMLAELIDLGIPIPAGVLPMADEPEVILTD